MSAQSSFSSIAARARATEIIREIESLTSAEVVMTVRSRSGRYRDADYLFGFIASVATLMVLLFHPQPFEILFFPAEVTLAFVLGAALCARAPRLRRLLVRRRQLHENVLRHAHAAFHEMGVSHTTLRTGILIYVSLFEKRVEVVPDVGVLAADPGPELLALRDKMRACVERLDTEAFFEAMKEMGPLLENRLPRSDDDVNELPDEVVAL